MQVCGVYVEFIEYLSRSRVNRKDDRFCLYILCYGVHCKSQLVGFVNICRSVQGEYDVVFVLQVELIEQVSFPEERFIFEESINHYISYEVDTTIVYSCTAEVAVCHLEVVK